MANLRKLARNKDCQIRLAGICNHNSETTVLAHYRMAGISGMGIKPSDLIAAWACSDCHAEVDRRTRKIDHFEARLAHAEGVFRTIDKLVKEGVVKW